MTRHTPMMIKKSVGCLSFMSVLRWLVTTVPILYTLVNYVNPSLQIISQIYIKVEIHVTLVYNL
jgi:hypothetical protein